MSDGPRRPRRRRTWPQRLLISLNVVVVLICFSSAAGLAFAFRQASDVQRFGGLSTTLDTTVEKGEPENYLLVGVDNSEGLDNKDPVLIGRSRKSLLSDTIMILRVDPGTQEAKILSLPRDLWVPIADTGSKQRINTALPGGGPERLIKTIQQDFGIPINHYVQVNFAGFKSLVDAVDGVPIYFPWPARDADPDEANNTHTGFLVEEPGCVTLNGTEALAYARSRHFQTKTGNKGKTWVTDASSDLGRIARQQQFIKLALKRAIAKGVRNPFVLNQLIGVAQGNVTLDDAVTTKDLLDLGSQFKNFDPDSLQVYTPPTTGKTTSGGAAVLILDNAGAQPIFDLFRSSGDTDNPLRAIQVDVTNGSGKTSQAQVVLAAFDDLGFTTIGSSDASSFRNSKTTVRYAPGAENAAVEVARYIDGTPQFVVDKTLSGNSVLLVTGKDFTQLRSEPRPPQDFAGFLATTTTTTVDPTDPPVTEPPTTDAGMVPEPPEGEVCG
jgi:LCP family protein required for cell wall assembly